jgi:biotin carboxyl carrier protein
VSGSAEPSWADLLELVSTLDASGYAEVDVEMPGLRLRMSTSPGGVGEGAAPAPAEPGAPPDGNGDAGTVAVVAPVMGTFYRRPGPDAEPFVEVGATVAADTTVAIVELMKLMNPVAAGVAGRVVEICAVDGDAVEQGEVLLRVEPEPAA